MTNKQRLETFGLVNTDRHILALTNVSHRTPKRGQLMSPDWTSGRIQQRNFSARELFGFQYTGQLDC